MCVFFPHLYWGEKGLLSLLSYPETSVKSNNMLFFFAGLRRQNHFFPSSIFGSIERVVKWHVFFLHLYWGNKAISSLSFPETLSSANNMLLTGGKRGSYFTSLLSFSGAFSKSNNMFLFLISKKKKDLISLLSCPEPWSSSNVLCSLSK